MAHEVNTPLAVISSYAQMLSKQLQGDPQKGALMEKITRQTFRASEIVNNLLNFSRTSGTEFAEVDVNKVILDTLALMEHQFKTSKVRVEDELCEHLPPIQGNAGRLQQVFLNLFLNAKDAMAEGGTLRIVSSNGDAVSVRSLTPATASRRNTFSASTIRSSLPKLRRAKGRARELVLASPSPTASSRSMPEKFAWRAAPGEGTTFYLDFPMTRKTVNV